MKERWVTLGLAVGALALFWMLLFPKPTTRQTAPRPLTTVPEGEGYLAVSRWLGAAGVPTLQLHQRFDRLTDRSVSARPTGNLLITTLPFDVTPHPGEYVALDKWVSAGNTLLILAALDDTPLWSAVSDNFLPELQKLTAIRFTTRQEPNQNAVTRAGQGLRAVLTPAGHEVELRPSGRISLLHGVRHLATLSPLPSTQWQAQAGSPAPVLELARRTDTADPVLWLTSSGNGTVVVSAYASVFTNGVIGKADNAQLLANLIAGSLRPGGRVLIDDAHQGVLDEYDAAQFYADPRLHRTLLWLVALWLAWVLATQSLRASAPNAGGLDESAMLRVTARFFAGVLRPVASAQWLLDEFFDRLRRRHGLMHSPAPPWDWLASHSGVTGGALTELRDVYARTQAGHRVDLVRLQRVISQISGQTS